jgi:hypothetical protein
LQSASAPAVSLFQWNTAVALFTIGKTLMGAGLRTGKFEEY